MPSRDEHARAMTMGENLVDEPTGAEMRDHAITYDEFITSNYARSMARRSEYYEGKQFQFDPTVTSSTLDAMITPAQWNAAWSGYGWQDLIAMLPDATQEQCIHPVSIPFTRIIIDNKQVVYSVPPEQRTLFKNNQPQEEASKLLTKVYKSCNHDGLADQLCKWTGLFDTAFQFIGWDARNKRIVKRNLKPYEVYVIPAAEAPWDLQHPDAFVAIAQLDQGITDLDSIDEEIVWQCWWRDRFWYEKSPKAEYKDAACTIKGTNPNPYRDSDKQPVKPILVTHSTQEVPSIYYESSDNLVLANQRLDRDFTAISHTMEYQGFSLLLFKGMTPAELRSISPSPGSAAAVPLDTEAEYLHPAIQIGELFSAILNKARTFARMNGVDPELVDPKVEVQSGVAKSHGRRALAERREEQFPKWVPYERESYWLTSTIWNYHSKTKKLMDIPRYDNAADDDIWNLEVVFGELDPVVDPLAESQRVISELKANLITRAQILQSRCRISEAAAQELADEIKKANEKDGIVADFAPNQMRIGQPGNRPTNPNRPADKTGGNVTGSSGNQTLGSPAKKPTPGASGTS